MIESNTYTGCYYSESYTKSNVLFYLNSYYLQFFSSPKRVLISETNEAIFLKDKFLLNVILVSIATDFCVSEIDTNLKHLKIERQNIISILALS